MRLRPFFCASIEVAPDALQEAVEDVALLGGEAGEESCDPCRMFIEQLMGRLLSKVGEPDRDLAPIFKPEVASYEAIALKSVDKAGDRRPSYASTLRQLMRGQAVRLAMQEKQKDEFAFGQGCDARSGRE